jgi:hypothetical protein
MLDLKSYIITVVILLFCYPAVVQAQPANDECSNAISISDNDTSFDSTGATNSAVPAASCGPLESDIWYKYTATCDGFVFVNTCDSDFDTVLVLYDGADCSSLSELSCDDDFCGGGAGSQVVGSVVSGQQYLVRVGGYNGATGSGTLNVTCELPVSNDECTDATALSVPSSTAGSTMVATNDGAAACGGVSTSPSDTPGVWYTVTGTGYTITATFCPAPGGSDCCYANLGNTGCSDSSCQDTVCASDSYCCDVEWESICAGEADVQCGDLCPGGGAQFDTQLSVYCSSCANPICVASNDDSCEYSSTVTWCSQAGTTYRILVNGYGGDSGDFDLEVSDDGTGCTPTVACEGGSCEEAQVAAQDAVDSGGPYRNHGKLVKTAAQAANQFDITEECHDCIVSQFARGIPIGDQEVCTDSGP